MSEKLTISDTMAESITHPLKNRWSFSMLFEAVNSNPNGDPDNGNLPRQDPDTGRGYVTPVCLKRKVKNEVSLMTNGKTGYDMYIRPEGTLNTRDDEAAAACGVDASKLANAKKTDPDVDKAIFDYMCAKYFDIRTFGAVMTRFSKNSYGRARGVVQLEMATSVSPITINDICITRTAVNTEADRAAKGPNTMGRFATVNYGLYRVNGTVNPFNAANTGFSEEDLELVWTALANLFNHDQSGIRSGMRVRKLVLFRHDSAYGNACDPDLFDRLVITEKNSDKAPSGYSDYEVSLNLDNLPNGITCIERL